MDLKHSPETGWARRAKHPDNDAFANPKWGDLGGPDQKIMAEMENALTNLGYEGTTDEMVGAWMADEGYKYQWENPTGYQHDRRIADMIINQFNTGVAQSDVLPMEPGSHRRNVQGGRGM